MPTNKPSRSTKNKSISVNGDVRDSTVIIGDNNTVNQTIIQKFFNIFKSDAETLEHRNRRILLGHVENAWIKGVLDASLHGAALLDLGIKQDPEAVTQYPWTLKKKSTKEILPAGTSMLEIFDSIGMGRSLLILGAPGSGKTTMLLELARGLIARAREDITYPIPMVFNLTSWTEKLSLADWLAQELNNLYSVPRKTAPDWVKGNKLLLLLDGLDEVRQESRVKCLEAINEFRKQNGLTSLAVCSRSQDYADLNAKLSFEGAIEVQPLTQEQITEFFNRFGNEMAGIKRALEKDGGLREMAETPLFLSIMLMSYQNKQDMEILISGDKKEQRKHLFDTYIQHMFERTHSKSKPFQKQAVLHWLSWLAEKMIEFNQIPYQIEAMQFWWLENKKHSAYPAFIPHIFLGTVIGLLTAINSGSWWWIALLSGFLTGFGVVFFLGLIQKIPMFFPTVDILNWSWSRFIKFSLVAILIFLIFAACISMLYIRVEDLKKNTINLVMFSMILFIIVSGWEISEISNTTIVGRRISLSLKNAFIASSLFVVPLILIFGLYSLTTLTNSLSDLLFLGFIVFLGFGGLAVLNFHLLHILLIVKKCLPFRLVPFLDHCVDLIFLRRVGGGYIFIHRLLMEHFAEMYVEPPTSKGNQK